MPGEIKPKKDIAWYRKIKTTEWIINKSSGMQLSQVKQIDFSETINIEY